jgi:predicted homoserine dehydrogenase-like protein
VPAEESIKTRYLPTDLTDKTKVIRSVKKDTLITYDDVEIDEPLFAYKLRKAIEKGEYQNRGKNNRFNHGRKQRACREGVSCRSL